MDTISTQQNLFNEGKQLIKGNLSYIFKYLYNS